jgi:hypothetical protein
LETLSPETSNDTETLGMWGSVHKRLWDLTNERASKEAARHLDEAVRGYERGFYLRNDYYNGINLAYLLNVRAANAKSRAEAVADFVQAERVRREVLAICESLLAEEKKSRANKLSQDARYWVLATMAEAYLGIGAEARAKKMFNTSRRAALKRAARRDTSKGPADSRRAFQRSDALSPLLLQTPFTRPSRTWRGCAAGLRRSRAGRRCGTRGVAGG